MRFDNFSEGVKIRGNKHELMLAPRKTQLQALMRREALLLSFLKRTVQLSAPLAGVELKGHRDCFSAVRICSETITP